MNTQTKNTEKSRCPGALQSLMTEDGQMQITVAGTDLPAFLLEANQAVIAGHIDQAGQCLCPENIARVERLIREGAKTDLMFIVAKLFLDIQQPGTAEQWFQRILAIEPHAYVYGYLSRICFDDPNRWTEAADYSRLAHENQPANDALHMDWAWSLVRIGQLEEGVRQLREAKAAHPDSSGACASYYWFSHYLPQQTRMEIKAGYQHWARCFAPASLAQTVHANAPDPERRLRIAYISPDFHRHAVAYFFEPVLDSHDRQCVELYGYGNVAQPDATTARFRSKFHQYRDIRGQDATTVAAWIEQDEIDILVELAGHVRDNRLDVLALKPAPIQVDFGGISTSGMPQIDYRITDEVYDPPETQDDYVEQCICLPGGLSCFCPPSQSPLVGPLPARQGDGFCFGSFNNNAKISPAVLSVWTQILKDIPQAHMIIKFPGGTDVRLQETYYQRFAARGVSRERIDILGQLPFAQHMDLYNRVDLLLDTYPYNGGITTLEGLWMGVPTLTWTGQTFVSRAGWSILTRLGLEGFVAHSAREYAHKASAFVRQTDELARIRCALRSMMLHSPLCDLTRVSRELERAYRRMWHCWCAT